MSRLWIAVRSLIYAPLFLAAWGWVGWMCTRLDKYIPLRVPSWLAAPGSVLLVAGAALALSTVALFVYQGFGTPALFDPPKKFVPHGPYRIVRNPMYVGGVAMLMGWGLLAKSISLLLYAVGVFLLIHAFVVLAEEPGLRNRFGNEYEEFCRAVPRWIPRFPSRGPDQTAGPERRS